jgi:hypothetical protein
MTNTKSTPSNQPPTAIQLLKEQTQNSMYKLFPGSAVMVDAILELAEKLNELEERFNNVK